MIFGRLSFEAPEKSFCAFSQIRQALSFDDAVFFSFGQGAFQGGFFLHSRFPETHDDITYFDEKEQLWIVVSGQIYNSAEISQLLGLPRSSPVPQLIGKAYLTWGPHFAQRLNGDFALVIYSEHRQELLVYRDHFGVQPLAWSWQDGAFFFSSDALSLCRSLFPVAKIRSDWFLNHFLLTNRLLSAHPEVKKLTPGHFLKVTSAGAEEHKYWFPEKIKKNKSLSYHQAVSGLHRLVRDAVAIRSDSRYKAGSHFSGGLDSALVAALARARFASQEAFPVFSYSPENLEPKDPEKDERSLVREGAQFANLQPVFLTLDKAGYQKILKDYFFNAGSIYEDAVRLKAREHGVNLLFSGWGGDEFISKSAGGALSDLFFELKWSTLLKSMPVNNPKALIKVLLLGILFPAIGMLSPGSLKDRNKVVRYLKKEYRTHDKKEFKTAFQFRSLKQWFLSAFNSHYLAERCEVWYLQGFRQGIAYRYPLLDRRIAEYVMQIPAKHFLQKRLGRRFMRDICKEYLPEKICSWKSKADHTLILHYRKMLHDLAKDFETDVAEWKQNPDLEFIDFGLLEKDMENFKGCEAKERYYLDRSLYFFKMLHEFTRVYRSEIGAGNNSSDFSNDG
ncbi:MAG TPA: asparagine synthase-related protein [Dissulfurispiraceae bacterium]|nr:asparagine synthase-related protein [Dissulfurispiraceae bacterium]